MAQEIVSFTNLSDSPDQVIDKKSRAAASGDPGDPDDPDRNKNRNYEDKKGNKKILDDILKDAQPGDKTKGKVQQYIKYGGFDQANRDFDSLDLTDVRHYSGGLRAGKLPDGRDVVVRPTSSSKGGSVGNPTLEIQRIKGIKWDIKIRYLEG